MRQVAKKLQKWPSKAPAPAAPTGYAKATWEEQSSVPAGERPPDERPFNTLEGLATPAHCFRFAHPAEADWRLEARKIEDLRKKSTPEKTTENHTGGEGLAELAR